MIEGKLILTFLTNALVILGVYNLFSPGQLFGFVRRFVLDKSSSCNGKGVERAIEITKPIYGCFVCMPSIWGSIGYLLFIPYQIWYLPVYVLALSGFMFLIKLYFYEQNT